MNRFFISLVLGGGYPQYIIIQKRQQRKCIQNARYDIFFHDRKRVALESDGHPFVLMFLS